MPMTLDRYSGFPGIAASNILANRAVKWAPGSVERGVCQATVSELAVGCIGQANATRGDAVTVHEQGAVVPAVAGASLGVGAEVNYNASGLLVPVAGASGVLTLSIGQAVSPADAALEEFSLYVRPKALSDAGAVA
jgi:hypothetical protein